MLTVLGALSITVALLLAVSCGGDDAAQRPRRTPTPGVGIGREVSLLGTVEALVGQETVPLVPQDVSPDGNLMLVRVSHPTDGLACSKLVTVSLDGEVRTLASDVSVVSFALPAGHAVFSPDGTRVAYLGTTDCANRASAEVRVVDAGGGAPATVETGAIRVWTWAGDRILFTKSEGGSTSLWEVGADGSGSMQRAAAAPVDVSKDGSTLAFLSENGVSLTFQRSGAADVAVTGVPPDVGGSFLAPDGSKSIFVKATPEGTLESLTMFDITGNIPVVVLEKDALAPLALDPPYSVAWFPDGSAVIIQGSGGPDKDPPAAYVLSAGGDVSGRLADGDAGLGAGIAARGQKVFFGRLGTLMIGVLDGPAFASGNGDELLRQVSDSFAVPKELNFDTVP